MAGVERGVADDKRARGQARVDASMLDSLVFLIFRGEPPRLGNYTRPKISRRLTTKVVNDKGRCRLHDRFDVFIE
jgi:hypothetical protein